mmetsp:Transcript_32314/g.74438  ORF Transcript_32314/g.74438 Transcript_32314/m.74438 type:complete len:438 (-) Transcript_32314:111-1424(-)|eukprot:CAMPEP_0113308782 /NCGR_PEP_ID=MMETSP0010_2-20120614/7095_1 /TAXON_ID=216773 ORGANISM="Corethron hystrix, Strain 308" /NCGR_SAMPLE_ID=MMETSP0010_2 /ASSEMBLY_ACC=CAM_ASM_000155 /LENGTH=437 /DNA_ID=CAMNT_0000163917 /DNA_START=222 /DNA_END=1535 /DNA_ORIENTATION=+ /assembly_acc=CAM_ASM_000155
MPCDSSFLYPFYPQILPPGQSPDETGEFSFGYPIGLSFDGAILSLGQSAYDANENDRTEDRGRVQILVLNEERNGWTQMGQDIVGDKPLDRVGYHKLSADGLTVAVSFHTYGQIRIYTYDSNENGWFLKGSVIEDADDSCCPEGTFDLSADGNTLVMLKKSTGQHRVLEYVGGNLGVWTNVASFASDESGGTSVEISDDGNKIMKTGDITTETNGESFSYTIVLFFQRDDNGQWNETPISHDTFLTNNIADTCAGSALQCKYGFSPSGDYFSIVSVDMEGNSSTIIYRYDDTTLSWHLHGQSLVEDKGSPGRVRLDINGDRLVKGNGKVFSFDHGQKMWILEQILPLDNEECIYLSSDGDTAACVTGNRYRVIQTFKCYLPSDSHTVVGGNILGIDNKGKLDAQTVRDSTSSAFGNPPANMTLVFTFVIFQLVKYLL